MRKVMTVAGLLLAAPAAAQQEGRPAVAIVPPIGVEATATAGSPIFQRENARSVPGVRLLEDAHGSPFRAGDTLELTLDRRGKVTACAIDPSDAMTCLTDRKPVDGVFDVQGDIFGLFPEALHRPAPYERGATHLKRDPNGTFRQQLTFLGVAGSTLRLSYREFANDLARPAFTDEVTFTLSGTWPETIAYKDVAIDVLGIGNAGMRYVVRQASSAIIPPPAAPR